MPAPDVVVTTVVARPPDQVWSTIADPARIVAFSPEASGVAGAPAGALAVGTTFSGSNRHGLFRWTTRCTVVESTPGQAFAFDVTYLGLAVSRWRYVVTEGAEGSQVAEEWTDHRGPLMKAIGLVGTGVADRRTHNERTMRATLDALRTELEES